MRDTPAEAVIVGSTPLALRWYWIARAVGVGVPLSSWIILFILFIGGTVDALLRGTMEGFLGGESSLWQVLIHDVLDFLLAVIFSVSWSAWPMLVFASVAKRKLTRSPSALPSVVGAVIGAGAVYFVIWIWLPILLPMMMMMMANYRDSDPAGTAQGWAGLILVSPLPICLAGAAGWMFGYIVARTRKPAS